MRHTLHMLAGCLLPLLLLFISPLFGVSGGLTLFIAIIALFIGRMGMMGGHGGHAEGHGGHGGGMSHEQHDHNGQTVPARADRAARSQGTSHEHYQH